ncbi:MAG: aminotransferase class III-fold pyridoxal phosphate-dependent enzyme [Myxococcales bacterium]|nr:MAG: aminotransferase class III-fold pyridoxal phosphate-dependent enzyme [Myxococcales bacterium]
MQMFQRATKVIPGGIPGHKNPAFAVPGSFPYFAKRGDGCRYWDVDDNEYIDFLCGYGPIVLGHNHPAVEAAAEEQRRQGYCFNHPTERTVELAEKMVETISIADWAVFGRNGSDVTTYAVQVAREFTQRRKVLMAKGAYHGSHAWCTPGHGGLIEEDFHHVLTFTYNNADELADLVKRCEGDVAAVILTPYHHPAFGGSIMPVPGFWNDVMRICRENGIVLISDDVRAGFRLDLRGSHEYFGFKPDLATYSKAMANGYSISSCVGAKELKNAASKVFFTGSFYTCSTEIAAAIACLKTLKEIDAVPYMLRLGEMLQKGLKERAEKHGLQIALSGPPSIPAMTFANETNFLRMQRFSGEAAKRGVLLHPHHNWFICAAHTEADIMRALDVADECFAVVKAEFGG